MHMQILFMAVSKILAIYARISDLPNDPYNYSMFQRTLLY